VKKAAIDCKNITSQTVVALPLSLKAANAIHVKMSVFLQEVFLYL